MAEGLLNAFWRGLLSQTANATTEINTNENEVCRRLILSGITVSAAGVITIPGLTIGTILVAGGGTGQVTLLNHGVLIGQGTNPVASAAVGTTGQVLTGVTGADPTFQTPAVPVTSVALTVPAEFTVAGSPVTTTGTLAVSKATQAANLVYAGPTSGGVVAPTFRALVVADLPVTDVPHGGTGVATLAAHGVVVGNGTGVVAVTSAGTTGLVLTSNGASLDPTYQAATPAFDRDVTVTDVINTVAETTVYTVSVPGGTLLTNRTLRLSLIGDFLSPGSRTMTLKLKFGATTVLTAAVTVGGVTGRGQLTFAGELCGLNATNAQAAKGVLTISNVGADAAGVMLSTAPSSGFVFAGINPGVTEDTTSSKTLAITFQNSVADGTTAMRCHTVLVELI